MITDFIYQTDLILRRRRLGLGRLFVVDADYAVTFRLDGVDKAVVVPKGMDTDLASIPAIVPNWIARKVDAHIEASIVHDWLYNYGVKFKQIADRAEADEIFFEAMVDCRVPLWRAWVMFGAVRRFGAAHFKDGTGAVK